MSINRASTRIFQIYYDQATKFVCDRGFIGLNNISNKRPDWMEFWPIFNLLKDIEMEDDLYYGFLSPKFFLKTGLTSSLLYNKLAKIEGAPDIILFSPGFDQICFFLNVFIQANRFHSGILDIAQRFFNLTSLNNSDLTTLVGHSYNSVFSNYFIAKKSFWDKWLLLSEKLFNHSENVSSPLFLDLNAFGSYNSDSNKISMKVFIQERIASFLMMTDSTISTACIYPGFDFPLFTGLFNDDPYTRNLLLVCDGLKIVYNQTSDPIYLDTYDKISSLIKLN